MAEYQWSARKHDSSTTLVIVPIRSVVFKSVLFEVLFVLVNFFEFFKCGFDEVVSCFSWEHLRKRQDFSANWTSWLIHSQMKCVHIECCHSCSIHLNLDLLITQHYLFFWRLVLAWTVCVRADILYPWYYFPAWQRNERWWISKTGDTGCGKIVFIHGSWNTNATSHTGLNLVFVFLWIVFR